MKFQINKTVLDMVLNKFGKLLTTTTSLPATNGVLVQATEKFIAFSCTDGSESMLIRELASEQVVVEEVGSIVVPKEAFQLTKKLKNSMISFTLNGDCTQISITQEKAVIDFSVLAADTFPAIGVNTPPTGQYKLPMTVFKSLIEQTHFAAATSDSRPILQGIRFSFTMDNDTVLYSVVATDSHRLAMVNSRNYVAKDNTVTLIPSSASMELAIKGFGKEGMIGIATYPNQIALINDNTILYSRILEGNYPDVSRLIPDYDSYISVNTKEIINALKLIEALKSDNVLMEYHDEHGTLTISSHVQGGISKAKQEMFVVNAQLPEKTFKMAFSVKYALQALSTITTTNVRMEVKEALRPFVCKNEHDQANEHDEALQLILPLRQYA